MTVIWTAMGMNNNRITLNQAIKFHGHLGPYLILGILAGALAVKKLGCKRYFGLHIKVYGAKEKPMSCLIDGLQLATGATYGKGNIEKLNGRDIRMIFSNSDDEKRIALSLNNNLTSKLRELKGRRDSEMLAKKLYKRKNYSNLFNLKTL
ncbi:MAG: formylmethanofuran dehydrogenase subunit E family protein [Candidatus Omnitrophota bacterium]